MPCCPRLTRSRVCSSGEIHSNIQARLSVFSPLWLICEKPSGLGTNDSATKRCTLLLYLLPCLKSPTTRYPFPRNEGITMSPTWHWLGLLPYHPQGFPGNLRLTFPRSDTSYASISSIVFHCSFVSVGKGASLDLRRFSCGYGFVNLVYQCRQQARREEAVQGLNELHAPLLD